jgi:hypothetical protein
MSRIVIVVRNTLAVRLCIISKRNEWFITVIKKDCFIYLSTLCWAVVYDPINTASYIVFFAAVFTTKGNER